MTPILAPWNHASTCPSGFSLPRLFKSWDFLRRGRTLCALHAGPEGEDGVRAVAVTAAGNLFEYSVQVSALMAPALWRCLMCLNVSQGCAVRQSTCFQPCHPFDVIGGCFHAKRNSWDLLRVCTGARPHKAGTAEVVCMLHIASLQGAQHHHCAALGHSE